MALSEVYFYMTLILFQIPSIFILFSSEDFKVRKYYLLFLKISLTMITIGGIMELIGWNYLCPIQCLFTTSISFLLLNLIKGITMIFEIIFKKEPFQMDRNKLSDGFWVKNQGDLKNKSYYHNYTFAITIIPILFLAFIYILIREITC